VTAKTGVTGTEEPGGSNWGCEGKAEAQGRVQTKEVPDVAQGVREGSSPRKEEESLLFLLPFPVRGQGMVSQADGTACAKP
jgi:hypothetical protein